MSKEIIAPWFLRLDLETRIEVIQFLTDLEQKHAEQTAEIKKVEAVALLDNIRKYELESGNPICHDERPSEALYDIYFNEKNGEDGK